MKIENKGRNFSKECSVEKSHGQKCVSTQSSGIKSNMICEECKEETIVRRIIFKNNPTLAILMCAKCRDKFRWTWKYAE